MKKKDLIETVVTMVIFYTIISLVVVIAYTIEKYGILVASSCLASLLFIGGIILIKLYKKNTDS
nr:MAG TPA: Lysostaphin [Caudoviricetes sp.]